MDSLVPVYKISRLLKMDKIVKLVLLPSEYKDEIQALDVVK